MKKYLVTVIFSFIFIALFSAAAEAGIRFEPNSLVCPFTREGEAVSCGNFVLKNKNIVLSATIKSVSIGDTKNFTMDASGCAGKTLRAGESCPLNVTFLAREGGAFSTAAKASYVLWGHSKVHNLSARIEGIATYPIVRLSTNDVPFGHQTIGTSHDRYVKMENIGTGILSILGMSLPFGSAFRVEDDCGVSLSPWDECDIRIFFEPTQAIEYASTLEIADDAHDSPQQIRLSGTGTDPGHADINIDKTHVDFGDLKIGTAGMDIVTLTSTGTVPLTITAVSALAAPYSQSNNCVGVFAPGQSCTINIVFEPAAVGAYNATISIVDDATDSPQTIILSGKGVSPNATLIPALLDFGNQTIGKSSIYHDVTLLNSGTSELTITDIQTSSPVFTQSNTCGESLEPKKMCTILVQFSPTEAGISSETLTVTTNDPGGPAKVWLFGRGITGPDVDISPTIFDFGNTPVGQTSEQQDFVIKNTGEGDLTLSSITVNSDFEQVNECPEVLVEEQTCVVEATFVPEVAGSFSGILSVVDNAEGSPHKATLQGYGTTSDITLLPASLNFDSQTVGRPSLARDVRMLNSGTETIDISGISSSSAEFAQTNDCPASLAPSNFCTINVIFTPSATEFYSGQIAISDSATGSPHHVSLTGTGIDPVYPDLDITPDLWDFGQILVGQTSAEKAFTVKNTGVVDVIIYGIDANSEYAQTNDCPGTLASGETCTIRGTFKPEAAGRFTGSLTVVDNTYDRYQSATLQGTGTHSGDIDVSFSASILDFGSVAPGSESTVQSVVLTSAGTDPVTIGAIEIVGSETVDFNMDTNCSDRSLDAGKSCIVNVVFKPTSSGVKTAGILFYDDAHDNPQSVAISGTGESSGGCSLVQHGGGGSSAPLAVMFAAFILVVLLFRTKRCQTEQ